MSRFVSAGAINAETGEAVAAAAAASGGDDDKRTASGAGEGPSAKKNAEWEIVQRELDAERKRREEARIKSVEGGEKSLYDILEANKGESCSRAEKRPLFSFRGGGRRGGAARECGCLMG